MTRVEMEWERAIISATAYKLQRDDPQLREVVQHDPQQEQQGRRTQRGCVAKVMGKYILPAE